LQNKELVSKKEDDKQIMQMILDIIYVSLKKYWIQKCLNITIKNTNQVIKIFKPSLYTFS